MQTLWPTKLSESLANPLSKVLRDYSSVIWLTMVSKSLVLVRTSLLIISIARAGINIVTTIGSNSERATNLIVCGRLSWAKTESSHLQITVITRKQQQGVCTYVKVRLVGVGRSVGVGVERGRTTSTVVDVRGGEGDTLSVLDIEVSLIMSKLATGN